MKESRLCLKVSANACRTGIRGIKLNFILIIVEKTVRFEIEGETCNHGEVYANVTCTATFSGHCPPRLQLRRAVHGQEEEAKLLNSSLFVTGPTAVHLETMISGDDLSFNSQLVCAVATPNSYIVLASASGMQKFIYVISWSYRSVTKAESVHCPRVQSKNTEPFRLHAVYSKRFLAN